MEAGNMDESKYGVHASHCCVGHGCKYGDPDCPVVNELIKQKYMCEDCDDDGYTGIPQKPSELSNIAFPKCAGTCVSLRHVGASECGDICPHKFKSQSEIDNR